MDAGRADVIALIRGARRPYEQFIARLRAEGRISDTEYRDLQARLSSSRVQGPSKR